MRLLWGKTAGPPPPLPTPLQTQQAPTLHACHKNTLHVSSVGRTGVLHSVQRAISSFTTNVCCLCRLGYNTLCLDYIALHNTGRA